MVAGQPVAVQSPARNRFGIGEVCCGRQRSTRETALKVAACSVTIRARKSFFPAAAGAKLLRARIVTEHAATFSAVSRVDRWRPQQTSPIPNLFLAGDWTATGWPATMEGAVRSGYLAAEAILQRVGK